MKIGKYPLLAVLFFAAMVYGTASAQAAPAQSSLCDVVTNDPNTLRCDEALYTRPGVPRGPHGMIYLSGPNGFMSNMLDGDSVVVAVAVKSGRSKVAISSIFLEDKNVEVLMRRGAPPTEKFYDLRCEKQQIDGDLCGIVDEGLLLSPLYIRLIARQPIEQSALLLFVNNGDYAGP